MATFARLAVAALAALLGACGGGGGDDGGGAGERCPPGTVVAIYPGSLRVTAGSPATAFGGGASGCTVDSRWTLDGPGSLDGTRGVPVHYTPPAAVDVVTTATLTMDVGGVSASAIITIDPAVLALAGRVMTAQGAPAAGARVKVGDTTATADAAGAFTLAGARPPYDLVVSSQDGLLSSVYPGLRRTDLTLVLFDAVDLPTTWWPSSGPLGGQATGTVSGGAGFPEPAGHEALVAFRSPEATAACGVVASTGALTLQAAWRGPAPTTSGALYALQWQVGAGGLPVAFDGYATRGGVTLTSGGSLAGQDLALSAIATATLSGTVADAQATALAARVVLTDGGSIRFVPPPSASTLVQPLASAAFTLATPLLPGATIDLAFRRDYAGSAFQEVHLHGLAPGASGLAPAFGGLPIPDKPVSGATGIGPGSTFTWYTAPGKPLYVVSFRPGVGAAPGTPSYDVFLTTSALTVPADLPFPRAAPYTWRVRSTTAFSTVEEAAGPGGFLAGAASYQLMQSAPSSFTTAP